jgi:hypothetical protein
MRPLMAKTIDTLIKDIYALFDEKTNIEIDPELLKTFGESLAAKVGEKLQARSASTTLRMSNLGSPCERQLYYKVNDRAGEEPLTPNTYIKFLFGDILEELLLFLAAAAGHTVEGRQDNLSIGGIEGHRDAIIDGATVDVKSASTYSFRKFVDGTVVNDDPFGYIKQLGAYMEAGKDDPRITQKNVGYFFAVDKQHGHLTLCPINKPKVDFEKLVEQKKASMASTTPPSRTYSDEPEGAKGNRKLGVNCSYCSFKTKCWPGLRAFGYSTGPKFLTVVKELPKVTELKY